MKRVKILLIGMLVVLGMTACGGKQEAVEKRVETAEVSAVEPKEKETDDAKEGASEVVVEAKQEVASEASVEAKEEATPEAVEVPETVVYEGIDMESTLPGKEWVETFVGIIEEPKYVVFNDETNKKVIVENGQEVVLAEGDILAVYIPKGYALRLCEGENVETTKRSSRYGEIIFKEGSTITTSTIAMKLYLNDEAIDDVVCTIKTEE